MNTNNELILQLLIQRKDEVEIDKVLNNKTTSVLEDDEFVLQVSKAQKKHMKKQRNYITNYHS